MKKLKAFYFFLSTIISLAIIHAVTLAFTGRLPFWGSAPWLGLAVGVVCMIIAAVVHVLGKRARWVYIISILLNAFGSGICIAACFTKLEMQPVLSGFAIPIAVIAGLMLLRCIISMLPEKAFAVINIILLVLNFLMSIASALAWIAYGGAYLNGLFPLVFFFLIPEFWNGVFLMAYLSDTSENKSCMRFLSFGSFGFGIAIAIVALFILSEGEILEGFDFPDLFGGKKKGSTLPK